VFRYATRKFFGSGFQTPDELNINCATFCVPPCYLYWFEYPEQLFGFNTVYSEYLELFPDHLNLALFPDHLNLALFPDHLNLALFPDHLNLAHPTKLVNYQTACPQRVQL